MYPHFIEINNTDLEGENIVNIDSIAFVCGDDEAQIILNIADREDNTINCKESYDEIKKLIRDSGCQIQMGDPRLDTTHPLTMDDLKDMVGQPVWDSNRNVWYLFKTFDEDGQAYFTDVFGNTGIAENEDTFIKYPLYRMKR